MTYLSFTIIFYRHFGLYETTHSGFSFTFLYNGLNGSQHL